MITVSQDRLAHCDENDNFYAKFSQSRLTTKIGRDLRSVYDDMTAGSVPDYLVELASRIDARRGQDRHED